MRSALFLVAAALLSVAACDQKPKQAEAPAAPAVPVSPAPAAAPVRPHLIREGVGVDGVELGMTVADVLRVKGTPVDQNKAGETVVFMSYSEPQIFGVYFDDAGRVRLIIVAKQDKTWCTSFDVCLYREGDLAKLKAHHGAKLLRFVDRDGSVTYRLLENGVLTEYTPVEERNGVVQVSMLYWPGPIDQSSLD